MTEEYRFSICINGHPVAEVPGIAEADRKPCPECGSKARQLGVNFGESFKTAEELNGKAKHPGIKKPSTVRVADEWNHDHQKPVTVSQTVNRVQKTYSKEVIGKDGTVIKKVKGPLKDQSLHGKQEPKKDESD